LLIINDSLSASTPEKEKNCLALNRGLLHPDIFLYVRQENLIYKKTYGVIGAGFAMTVMGWGFPMWGLRASP
jgi:hypothetical protein